MPTYVTNDLHELAEYTIRLYPLAIIFILLGRSRLMRVRSSFYELFARWTE